MLESSEGRVNHFYRDSRKGLITVGIGCAFPKASEASSLPMFKLQGNKKATAAEVDTEYEAVMAQPKGMAAEKYTFRLIINDSDINTLRDQKINQFYKELRTRYSKTRGYGDGFDGLPPQIQLALFDMIYNLGGPALMRFRNMNNAIKARSWDEAANFCNRKGPGADRNTFVRKLFQKAGAIEASQ